jgi:hypothetical protein
MRMRLAFLVGGAVGFLGYLVVALLQIVRSLAAARPAEPEGVAAVAVAWGRLGAHALLCGLAVGGLAAIVVGLVQGGQDSAG